MAARTVLQPALRVVTAAALLAIAVAVARRSRTHLAVPDGPAGRIRALAAAYAAAIVLLAVNAASPYVGLKTEASFAMFSNLQPSVFGAQDELVRLESASAPTPERRRRAGILMVRAELERYLRQHPGERATYVDARRPARRFTASAATVGEIPSATGS